MFDVSDEGVLLRRHETACEREFHKSIADLMRLEKEHGGEEPEPVRSPTAEDPSADCATEAVPEPPVASRNRVPGVVTRNEPRAEAWADPRPP